METPKELAPEDEEPGQAREPREREDPVVELVAEALTALEEEGPVAVDALCERHPEHAATIRRRLALLGESGLELEGTPAPRVEMPEVLGDFRLLRPLGGGGMGVVWLAEQRSLGREVAVKVVRPDQLLFPGMRERFRREVETIAQLSHPGIVPVYAVGEERGLPYFAMERVHGASLSEVLRALEGRDAATLAGADLARALPADRGGGAGTADASRLFDGAWPTVCARLVREVAEALEHARRRGVLHRDVKPSNVMVTRGGRVLLLDFGLSVRAGDARITRAGSAVGSLAYMAPELQAGPPPPEDPRQDVYSLGVTLYELLAHRLPFEATSEPEVLRKILAGDVVPLRRLLPEVSWELATIVAVAMDRDPARRYADAGAMARDLGRALERRPIEARPPGAVLRLRRWVQRHPARAVVLAALVVGPSVLLAREVQNRRVVESKNREIGAANAELVVANDELGRTNEALARSNADLEAALEETRRQRAVAQASFAKALEAVDRMLLRVGEHRLAGEPRMEGVRRELVADALDLYGWFLEQDASGRGLERQVARVALTAGGLHGEQADLAAAEQALARAEELLDGLVAADPEDVEAVLLSASVDVRRALVLRLSGRVRESAASADAALAHLGTLDAAGERELGAETRREARRLASSAWSELGLTRESTGDLAGAVAAQARAIELLRGVEASGPEGSRVRYDLARALDHHARLVANQAVPVSAATEPDLVRLEEALVEQEEAVALLRALAREDPTMPEPRFRLARALTNLGFVLSNLGELDAGRAATVEAAEVLEELFRDYPGVPIYGSDLALTCINLAAHHGLRGELEEGRRFADRAIATFERVVPLTPADANLRSAYATALVNRAGLEQVGGDHVAALGSLEQAQAEIERALALQPANRQMLGTGWMIHHRRGEVALLLEDPIEALLGVGGMLNRGPGAQELESWSALVLQALERVPEEAREEALALAAAPLAGLLEAGGLDEDALFEDPVLVRLMEIEGFAHAFDAARGY